MGGVIVLITISCMAIMPQKISAQYKIKCESPTSCDGWLYHNNKIGIGTGWDDEAYIPRTTLHLHEFNSANTFINITNQTTGFPQGSQTLGMFIGMMGNKAIISNFQNDNIIVSTDTIERLIIQPDGKVGIGTAAPVTLLDVNGQLTIRGGNPGDNKVLISDHQGTASWKSLNGGTGISINELTITNTAPDIPINIQGSGLINVSGTYPNFTISAVPYTAGTGISINGTTINSVWTKDANDNIYNNNSNKVGIGLSQSTILPLNSQPANLLQIHGRTTIMGYIEGLQITHEKIGKTMNDGLIIGYEISDSRPNFVIINKENGGLKFGTNNTIQAIISSGGNVGIGVQSPTARLHINGTVRMENISQTMILGSKKIILIDSVGNLVQANVNIINDNLGNHIASQNIVLNNNWISNDGDYEGIKINNNGDVLIYGKSSNTNSKTFEQNHGLEIVTHGRIPERRGISLDSDPQGNLNFWIHNWQNPAAFNFMRNDQGSTKKLMTITKQGYVGINIDNPSASLHTRGSIKFEQLPHQQYLDSSKFVLITDAGGTVNIYPAIQMKDNLGNHTATQNINLGANWLSPDGNDKGIQLKENGNVQVGSGITQINIGKAYSNAPLYLSNYIGFNAQRNDNGQWTFSTDGANNGGAAIITDVAGNLSFITYCPQQGNTNFSTTETDIIAHTSLYITSKKQIGLRTNQVNPNADIQLKGNTYVEDKLGIGICLTDNNNPKGYRFAVNGTIGAKDVYIEIDETPWPDYVFEHEHRLMPLTELEAFVKQNKHLPDIPSANDIKENGLSLAEINALLVKKVEELTLYVIELNKKIEKYENK